MPRQSWSVSQKEVLPRGHTWGIRSSGRGLRPYRSRTLSAAKGDPTFTIPKSAKCRRRVTLTEGAVDTLQRHHHKQLQEKAMVGTEWQDNGLVFCSIVGTPLSRNNLHNRSFKPLLGRAGLTHIRFHDLRHTCGTIMGSMGVDPKYAQDRLGHADISVTLNTYTHVLPEVRAEVARKIEEPFTARQHPKHS
jgi:integrase